MVIASWLLGVALILAGISLFWLRPPDWQQDGHLRDAARVRIQKWSRVQRMVRIANNTVVILMGGLIIATTLLPRGKAWGLMWAVVMFLLLTSLVLAAIDAYSSLMGYRSAYPEAAHRAFGDRQEGPNDPGADQ